jgi:hypothetical protein
LFKGLLAAIVVRARPAIVVWFLTPPAAQRLDLKLNQPFSGWARCASSRMSVSRSARSITKLIGDRALGLLR